MAGEVGGGRWDEVAHSPWRGKGKDEPPGCGLRDSPTATAAVPQNRAHCAGGVPSGTGRSLRSRRLCCLVSSGSTTIAIQAQRRPDPSARKPSSAISSTRRTPPRWRKNAPIRAGCRCLPRAGRGGSRRRPAGGLFFFRLGSWPRTGTRRRSPSRRSLGLRLPCRRRRRFLLLRSIRENPDPDVPRARETAECRTRPPTPRRKIQPP